MSINTIVGKFGGFAGRGVAPGTLTITAPTPLGGTSEVDISGTFYDFARVLASPTTSTFITYGEPFQATVYLVGGGARGTDGQPYQGSSPSPAPAYAPNTTISSPVLSTITAGGGRGGYGGGNADESGSGDPGGSGIGGTASGGDTNVNGIGASGGAGGPPGPSGTSGGQIGTPAPSVIPPSSPLFPFASGTGGGSGPGGGPGRSEPPAGGGGGGGGGSGAYAQKTITIQSNVTYTVDVSGGLANSPNPSNNPEMMGTVRISKTS